MTELDFLAPITVRYHAMSRARERFGREVEESAIRGAVRVGVLERRVSDRRPLWTILPGSAGPGRGAVRRVDFHFVWDEDATHCWVVGRDLSGGLHVHTLLLDRDVLARNAERLHVLGARRT